MELDYTDLIEHILESLDLNYTRRDGYYLTQSPYGQDNVSSFQIFLDGFAVSYNQDIDGESRIPIKKICVDLGFLQNYISFIVDKNNIPIYKLNQYRELIIKKNLKEIYNYKKYRKLRDLFNEFYISQADVLGINELNNIQKIRKAKSRKKKRTRIIEVTQTEEEYQQCLEYITGRKIQFEDGRIESVTLMINSWRVNAIAFRHTNGHVKYRLLNDDFRYISTGRYEVPFIVKNENNKKVIVGEGQCYPKEVEIFTKKGWVFFDEYNGEDVLQYDKHKQLSFVKPLNVIKKEYEGLLYEIDNRNHKIITTADHKMVYIKDDKFYKREVSSMGNGARGDFKIPKTGILDGVGIGLTDYQIALSLACSADFTYDKPTSNGIYMRGCFKKERKKSRFEFLLNKCDVPYKRNDNLKSEGYTQFTFHKPDWLWMKLLPKDVLSELSLKQRLFIINEMVFWDGNSVPNRKQVEYVSVLKHNIDWMQFVASSCNYTSTVIPKKDKYGFRYKLSVLFNKQTVTWPGLNAVNKIDFKGKVYCVTVPSGMIMVRYKDRISINGNCDMESIRNIQDYDIFAMANTNSLGDLTILENYDECVILIDNDTIHKVETGIRKKITEMYPNIKLKIVSKFDSKDKSLDFNKFLIDNDEKELLDYLQKRLDINK